MHRFIPHLALILSIAAPAPAQSILLLDSSNTWAVSVRSLLHKAPKAARKEFDQGMKDWNKHKEAQAGPHFARAVALDPDYAEAQEMLGVYAARDGQMDLALHSFQRAVDLEPGVSDFQANTALLLLTLGRHAEAEAFARRATRSAPSSPFAHFVQGLAIVGQEQATPEAAASLRIAVEKYPQAAPALQWVRQRLSPPR